MRLFDSPVTLYSTNAFSVLVLFVILLSAVVIWNASPATMGKFKLWMMKMTVSDLIFTLILEFFYIPNLLFPIPAAEVSGLSKFFGHTGVKLTHIFTIVAGAATLVSVLDCCIYRVFLFFKWEVALEKFSGRPAIRYVIFYNILVFFFITAFSWRNTMTYADLVAYAKKYHHENIIAEFDANTQFFGLDLDKPLIRICGVIAGIWIAGVEFGNVLLTLMVMSKINESKSSMSRETLRMQRSLNLILLAQTAIPGVAISLPTGVQMIGLCFPALTWIQSNWVMTPSVLFVASYPLINSAFCIYFMKPYRLYCKKLISKVAPCVKEYGTSSTVVSLAAQSSDVA